MNYIFNFWLYGTAFGAAFSLPKLIQYHSLEALFGWVVASIVVGGGIGLSVGFLFLLYGVYMTLREQKVRQRQS